MDTLSRENNVALENISSQNTTFSSAKKNDSLCGNKRPAYLNLTEYVVTCIIM